MTAPAAPPAIPLTREATKSLAALAVRAPAIGGLEAATLLGERARLEGHRIGGRIASGGGCRLIDAADGTIALNLARADDRDLLPALFEDDGLDPFDDGLIAAAFARRSANGLVARGRMMGLAVATVDEAAAPAPAVTQLAAGLPASARRGPARVLDLSALWAGPLAAHLFRLAGAEVWKVENPRRPDGMRAGGGLFALLNQGKASVALDFAGNADRTALLALIAAADIVIEAARPRALAQAEIDADRLVATVPGLVWLTITAHGATGDEANWTGFGDDVGVAAGLSAAMAAAGGGTGFVGDAIADPLAGIHAAEAGWAAWEAGRGGRIGIAMRGVAAACLANAREDDPLALAADLRRWGRAAGAPFPPVPARPVSAPVAPLGADTRRILAEVGSC